MIGVVLAVVDGDPFVVALGMLAGCGLILATGSYRLWAETDRELERVEPGWLSSHLTVGLCLRDECEAAVSTTARDDQIAALADRFGEWLAESSVVSH